MALRDTLRRPRTWVIAVPVLVLLAVVGGPFVYINFIKEDAPERLTFDSARRRRRRRCDRRRRRPHPRQTLPSPSSTRHRRHLDGRRRQHRRLPRRGDPLRPVLRGGRPHRGDHRDVTITGTIDRVGRVHRRPDDRRQRRRPPRQPVPRPDHGHGTFPTATFELAEPIDARHRCRPTSSRSRCRRPAASPCTASRNQSPSTCSPAATAPPSR